MPFRAFLSFLLTLVVSAPLFSAEQAVPRTTLTVDGDTVTILRDSFGVPHVYASTLRGLFYGDGYAVAQDRLWQLERYRHSALGRLAEIEGKEALKSDRETRLRGYTLEEYRAVAARLEPEIRAIFEAYRDGVNTWIEQAAAAGKLPEGYAKTGTKPARWELTDSVAIGTVIAAHRFGSGGGGELRNLRIMRKLNEKFGEAEARKVFADLFWVNDPKSPTTITEDDMKKPRVRSLEAPRGRPNETERDMLGEEFSEPIIASAERHAEMRDILDYAEAHQLPTRFGSYAIVIGPKRSVSGNPLLVGGPQMGFMTPQIAHEVHLSGAGFDVIGMGFAGIPGVLIGHNTNLAWTTTSGIGDLIDIFEEKLDSQNKRRYLFKGRMRDMQCREEAIQVLDGEPDKMEVCRTVHGPVLEWDEKAGVAYSLAAVFQNHEMDGIRGSLGFNRARSVQEFATYAALLWTSHNYFAADKQGNIGYWHCGKPPLRASGFDPHFPLPGTGEAEWRGEMPFEAEAQVINPSRGYIANWNNKPAPWQDNVDTPVWGEIFRVHRIQKLVEAQPELAVEHLRAILADIGLNDPNADYFKQHILDAVERSHTKDPGLLMAAHYLRAWNNHGEDQSVGKALFDAWLSSVRVLLFKDELGDVVDKQMFAQLMQPSFILHVLEGQNSGVPVRHDYLKGRTHDQVVLDALREAIAELKKNGPQMYAWGFQAPMLNAFKPLPPVPETNRGTYIQIVEVGDPIRGVSILPPGQSEDPHSPHYSDQLGLSSWWRFKPMVSDRAVLEKPPSKARSEARP